jgi:hypothetical protein
MPLVQVLAKQATAVAQVVIRVDANLLTRRELEHVLVLVLILRRGATHGNRQMTTDELLSAELSRDASGPGLGETSNGVHRESSSRKVRPKHLRK